MSNCLDDLKGLIDGASEEAVEILKRAAVRLEELDRYNAALQRELAIELGYVKGHSTPHIHQGVSVYSPITHTVVRKKKYDELQNEVIKLEIEVDRLQAMTGKI